MDAFDRERELAYLTRVIPGQEHIPDVVAIYEVAYLRSLQVRGPSSAIEVALAEGLITLDQAAFDLIPETCRIVTRKPVTWRSARRTVGTTALNSTGTQPATNHDITRSRMRRLALARRRPAAYSNNSPQSEVFNLWIPKP